MPYAAFSILADFRLLNGIFFFFLLCFFASAVRWHGGQGSVGGLHPLAWAFYYWMS